MDKDSALAETEANYFAAALLMPRQEFIDAYKKYGGDVVVLSNIFKVHFNGVKYRIRHLQEQGFLDDAN